MIFYRSFIDQKYSFKKANTFETSLSDHYLLIYLMLKTSFQKNESKRLPFQRALFKPICQNQLEILNAKKVLKLKPLKS